jgi:hypothetical protein
MKIYLFACSVLFLISCKKEYHCGCSSDTIDNTYFIIRDNKSNAKKKCKQYETNGQLSYTTTGCKLVN